MPKTEHEATQESPKTIGKAHPSYVIVPVLKPSEVRRMIKLGGFTLREFSKWMGKSKNYMAEKLAAGKVPVKIVEALYLFMGHDVFWTLYDRRTVAPMPLDETLATNTKKASS